MKNIIALYGPADTGKTTTIKKVYDLLGQQFSPVFQPDFEQIKPGDNEPDICVVLVIKGKIVGIESQGDPNSRSLNSIPAFAKIPCDLILCTSRTRGMTVEVIEEQAATYQIDWVEKTHSATKAAQQADNDQVAADLARRLAALL